jgi:hypothetical protein
MLEFFHHIMGSPCIGNWKKKLSILIIMIKKKLNVKGSNWKTKNKKKSFEFLPFLCNSVPGVCKKKSAQYLSSVQIKSLL